MVLVSGILHRRVQEVPQRPKLGREDEDHGWHCRRTVVVVDVEPSAAVAGDFQDSGIVARTLDGEHLRVGEGVSTDALSDRAGRCGHDVQVTGAYES